MKRSRACLPAFPGAAAWLLARGPVRVEATPAALADPSAAYFLVRQS
jgi:hypothetical protein